jgi:thiamine-phosphate pyrophosphorylase
MNFRLPRLYPITDTRLSGLSQAEQVRRMIAGGAKLIQLREKHASPAEFYQAAEKAIEIAHSEGVKIIINDRVDIALALKADGVHLGQDDLPPAEARKVLGDKAIIGFSTHNMEQVRAALELPVDYLAFGPVFTTTTKENPDPVTGLELLALIRQALGDPPPKGLVAIGGINETNFRDVFAAGANSAAIISAVVSHPDSISGRVKFFSASS